MQYIKAQFSEVYKKKSTFKSIFVHASALILESQVNKRHKPSPNFYISPVQWRNKQTESYFLGIKLRLSFCTCFQV